MVYSSWLSALGWGIFFLGLVASIIIFSVKRKFYPVMYLASIAIYIFTIGFMVDAFKLGKNWILILLVISSILFILAGVWFSYKFQRKKSEILQSLPPRRK